MTHVVLLPLEVLKGHAPVLLTIAVPGGELDGYALRFTDAPEFRVGSTHVVFLDASRRVVGWRLGSPVVRYGDVPGLGMSLHACEQFVERRSGSEAVVLRPHLLAAVRASHQARDGSARDDLSSARAVGAPRPVVTSMSPKEASAGTHSRVTIVGRNFLKRSSDSKVEFFYRRNAPRITAKIVSWSDRRIVCEVPVDTIRGYPASSGSGPVTVRNSARRTSNGFDYQVSFGYLGYKWPTPRCTYRINDNCDETVDARALVEAAMGVWSHAGGVFSFVREGDGTCVTYDWQTNNGHNDVFWSSTLLSEGVTASTGILAQTRTRKDGGRMLEFDICFNDQAQWGDGTGGTQDVEYIALHELGHALGLRDLYGQDDWGKVMYGQAGLPRRNLTSADIAGIRWIYPYSVAYTLNDHVFTVRPEGGTPEQLTASKKDDCAPVWSADRQKIAFLRGNNYYGPDPGNFKLWMMKSDGTGEHEITYQGPSLGDASTALAWSPDGRYIAGACRSVAQDRSSDLVFVVLDLQTMTSAPVYTLTDIYGATVCSLDWSPDSRQLLACTCWADPGPTVRIDVASGSAYQYEVYGYEVSWNPAGGSFLFLNFGPDAMYRTELRRIDGSWLWEYAGPSMDSDVHWWPRFSPAGDQYAYLTRRGDYELLQRARLDGSGTTTFLRIHDPRYQAWIRDLAWK